MTSNFRVQARNTGETWKTQSNYSGLEGAERAAVRLAGQRGSYGCPRFQYVRVMCGDQQVFSVLATDVKGDAA